MNTKKLLNCAVLGAATSAASGLRAEPVRLDFETLPNFTEVLGSYAGFQFSQGAYAFLSQTLGGSGTFYGGAPDSARGALILDGVNDLPNNQQRLRVTVAEGFSDFFSVSVGFLPGAALSIRAFDDSGLLLAGTTASNFSGANGCTPPSFICQWSTVRLNLAAGVTARYVELQAPGGAGWLDDLTFGNVGPATPVPEPASAWMTLGGLAALALSRRRLLPAR